MQQSRIECSEPQHSWGFRTSLWLSLVGPAKVQTLKPSLNICVVCLWWEILLSVWNSAAYVGFTKAVLQNFSDFKRWRGRKRWARWKASAGIKMATVAERTLTFDVCVTLWLFSQVQRGPICGHWGYPIGGRQERQVHTDAHTPIACCCTTAGSTTQHLTLDLPPCHAFARLTRCHSAVLMYTRQTPHSVWEAAQSPSWVIKLVM